jgi:hypothetical protein
MSFFFQFCRSLDLTVNHLRGLNVGQCILLLGAFVTAIKAGTTLQKTRIMAATISGYVRAAHMGLELIQDTPISIYAPGTTNYHPYLSELLVQRNAWQQKKPKKEPYSSAMFEWLHRQLHGATNIQERFLSAAWCVYDTQRLGVFTGSRISEYAQSKVPKGKRYNRIPDTEDAGVWRDCSMAFLRCDFEFYDTKDVMVPMNQGLMTAHLAGLIISLDLRFRFDKSSNNFIKRKYRKTGHEIFDPLDAAVHIIHRANRLGVPDYEPVCAVRAYKTKYRFLNDRDITTIMRTSVRGAYPNPNHYMQIHIERVVPHSNQVTAAVCLKQGGAHNDEIAHRLRWHPSSVPTYLRECFQQVGSLLRKTILGVLQTAD